jgi:hypothetical protein
MTRIWKKRGIPHTGWKFVRTIDHGIACEQCEMCDQPHIRYIAELSHEDYTDLIRVGQDCEKIMLLPGRSGFRWPAADKNIFIFHNELKDRFQVSLDNKPATEITFDSLKEAKSWVLENLIFNS